MKVQITNWILEQFIVVSFSDVPSYPYSETGHPESSGPDTQVEIEIHENTGTCLID